MRDGGWDGGWKEAVLPPGKWKEEVTQRSFKTRRLSTLALPSRFRQLSDFIDNSFPDAAEMLDIKAHLFGIKPTTVAGLKWIIDIVYFQLLQVVIGDWKTFIKYYSYYARMLDLIIQKDNLELLKMFHHRI